jgi:hypothetical protein
MRNIVIAGVVGAVLSVLRIVVERPEQLRTRVLLRDIALPLFQSVIFAGFGILFASGENADRLRLLSGKSAWLEQFRV